MLENYNYFLLKPYSQVRKIISAFLLLVRVKIIQLVSKWLFSSWHHQALLIDSWYVQFHCTSMWKKVKVCSLFSQVWLFATPWTVAWTKLLHPRGFQGESTGVGCHFLLQGIFPTQGSNPGLLHCRQTLCFLSHQGSPHDRAYHEEFKHLGGHESILEELPLTLRLEGRKGTSEEMKPISGC